MADHRDIQDAVDEGERWLRDRLEDPTCPNREALKLHAQVALDELWLRDELRGGERRAPAGRIKSVVRRALAQGARSAPWSHPRDTAGNGRSRWSVRRWIGPAGLAAAAAVVVLMTLNERPTAGRLDFPASDAFADYRIDELSLSLTVLSRDMDDLETYLGSGSWSDTMDDTMNELLDTIDTLMPARTTGTDGWSFYESLRNGPGADAA